MSCAYLNNTRLTKAYKLFLFYGLGENWSNYRKLNDIYKNDALNCISQSEYQSVTNKLLEIMCISIYVV